MLKNLIRALRTNDSPKNKSQEQTTALKTSQPAFVRTELERSEHNISRKNISKGALNIIYDLNNAGYEAYLVGGGIRDLLLGLHPKDFDVATNATPEEIKRLFRRARIVGRRFQIVHVSMGRETIEVTTFRANHTLAPPVEPNDVKQKSVQSESGMLLRDNVFGSIEEDALRRDFTANALYYTVKDFKIIDFTGGLADIESKTLRMIGDPTTRYLEDPVRMLRAIRFAAKLNFSIEEETQSPIYALAENIQQVAAARLFEEVNKLFLNINARCCFKLSLEYNLFQQLFPTVCVELDKRPIYKRIIEEALSDTSQRIQQHKPITPAFMYACMLWPRVETLYNELLSEGNTAQHAMQIASFKAIDEQYPIVSIPKRFSIAMREIWSMQHSLIKANNKRALNLLSHPRFRAAYDFLLLRERAGAELPRGAKYWTDLQEQHPVAVSNEKRRKRHHRPRRGNNKPKT